MPEVQDSEVGHPTKGGEMMPLGGTQLLIFFLAGQSLVLLIGISLVIVVGVWYFLRWRQ